MKRRMLALALVLCMALAMLPAAASATAPQPRLELNAIPAEADLQSESYPLTFAQNKGGTITCDVTQFQPYEYVDIYIKADAGYYVDVVYMEFEYMLTLAQLEFLGFNHYRLYTPQGKVNITVTFTKLSGKEHKIDVIADDHCTWSLDRTTAQHHETVYLDVSPDKYYSSSIYAVTADGMEEVETYTAGYYPNWRLEFHMPDEDMQIVIETSKGSPYSIKAIPFNDGGTVSLSTNRACYGDTVQLTILPKPGYRPLYIIPQGGPGVEETVVSYVGSNIWNVTMPNNEVILLVSFEESDNPFMDVADDAFYYDSVMWALENGITNGTDLSHFAPGAACNRAQAVTFLWRAEGSPEPTTAEHPFVDVEAGSFYEKAVLWAVEQGITTGTDETHFSPNMTCNRATVVTFLHRAFNEPAVEGAENPFTDVPADTWYTAPVLWAVEQEITNGMGGGLFGVNDICNRAQIVTFLYRAYTD